MELLERLELLEQRSELRVRRDFKHDSVHARRRIAQQKNLPPQPVIRDLSGDAGKFFAVDGYFHRRIVYHVLTPVLAVDFARGRIITAVLVNQAQFYGPRSIRFSSDRCQIGYQSRSIFQIHGLKYKPLPAKGQAQRVATLTLSLLHG